MRVINSFSLAEKAAAADEGASEAPRTEVLREGRTVGLTIEGATLEAQYAVNAGVYLLLVTDNCPYEETLRAYLLDEKSRVIDQATLAYAYTAAVARDFRIVDGNSIDFAFTASSRYRLTVHSRQRHFWNASGGFGEIFNLLKKRRIEITRGVFDEPKESR